MCMFSIFPCRRNVKSNFFTDYVSSTYPNTKKIGLHFLFQLLTLIWPKFGKEGPKWAENRVFWILTKILSINLCFFLLKRKVYMVLEHTAKTACPGKLWFSKFWAKSPKLGSK